MNFQKQKKKAHELYKDIIHKKRPISKKSKMSNYQRAAQFSPFAALVGHEDRLNQVENSRLE